MYPEKHFEQISVNNDFFSGVIKWQSNRKPSWTKREVDQWRFELRFDEVTAMSHTVCVHSVCKIKSNFKYFHQVKSGVEKQYGNGRLITSFNFPNQENFFLYGIRKFYKVSSKIAFQATYFSDNPSTLFGTVFYCDAADHTVGVYSFHFKDETNCWIDFTRSSRYHYNYHNGRKPNSDGI